MIAYKLLRLRKNGTLGPLFINQSKVIPIGVWLEAEDHPTNGFAHRPGWHCSMKKETHIKMRENRVWAKVHIQNVRIVKRPANQGGYWLLAQKMKVLEVL